MEEYAVYKIVNGCQCATPEFEGSREECRQFWSMFHNEKDLIVLKY